MSNTERIYYILQENDCGHWFRDNADTLKLAEYLDKRGYIVPLVDIGSNEQMMMCDNCPASKEIKDTRACNEDRLHNAWEDLKHEIFKLFKYNYQPKYQCRFADLVEMERREGNKVD